MIFILLIASYLIGSLSFAVILSKLLNLPDPRKTGSNNPGATNVLRVAGKKYAILVLLGDMLKGFIPVFICKAFDLNLFSLGLICIATVLGHIYPVFFKFKGGKGVATALGALLGLHLSLGIIVLFTWLIIALITRYSSLAAIISIALAPFYAGFLLASWEVIFPLFFVSLLIIYKHKDNILRLKQHTESKIKF